jgi:CheY-like chemotaxis protein
MKDGKHVILYVEDDQDFLDGMKLVLESNGYAFVPANSGEEGIRRYKDVQPDLVIVDLMMEEVDAGTSFVKELKAMGSKVPIYMVSSVGDALTLSTDYRELGLAGVLQKPVNPSTLLSLLRSKLK